MCHALRLRTAAWAAAFAISVWTPAFAGPSLESVDPGVGQRGTEFTLKIVGAGLSDAEEVLFYRPGVTCTEIKPASDNELHLKLAAAADCPLGSHGFRVRTRRGVSELRIFRVTPLPVVASREPNNDPASAQAVELGVTVAGVVESGDVDCYKVMLKAGENLSAEVEAVRMGNSLFDTVLTIRDPDGVVLNTVDDTPLFRQDPFVSIVAPKEGVYTIEVRETNNEGDENARYALHVGRFPRPAAVFPAGAPIGETTTVRFLGDAGGGFTQRVSPTAGFELFAERDAQKTPTATPFRVSDFPNVMESGSGESAGAARLPAAFNGIVSQPGQVDTFRFHANEGEKWQFELFASRIGSPLDAVMTIRDESGETLGRCDDYDSHDPRLVIVFPETGTYQLDVTDKRNDGGPLFVYRVEATQPKAALTAFLPRPNRLSQERQTINIPRGNRVVMFVAAKRKDVGGPLQVAVNRLPQGVVYTSSRLEPDHFWTPVVFEASADAPVAGRLSGLEVSGEWEGRSVYGPFQQVIDLVNGPADALYESYVVDQLAVAVTEPAPFMLRLDSPTAGLSRDGTIALQVHIDRAPDFTSAVEVTFPFLPPWVDGPDTLTIPEGKSSAVYVARAWQEAVPRTWPICAEAKPGLTPSLTADMIASIERPTRGRRSRTAAMDVRVASRLVELNIIPAPVTGSMPSIAGEQGQTVVARCEVNIQGEVPESMIATLEGVPNRVSVEPVSISRDQRVVEFAVKLGSDAPVGEFPSLLCRLSGKLKTQDVSFVVGRGCVLEIKPPGTLVTDSTGRPLTRLEVLRREKERRNKDSAAAASGEEAAAPAAASSATATSAASVEEASAATAAPAPAAPAPAAPAPAAPEAAPKANMSSLNDSFPVQTIRSRFNSEFTRCSFCFEVWASFALRHRLFPPRGLNRP
jgi:hypothetical protein